MANLPALSCCAPCQAIRRRSRRLRRCGLTRYARDGSGAIGRTRLRLQFMDAGTRDSPFRWIHFEKSPARQRLGDSRFNRFLIQGELNIWVYVENEGLTRFLV